MEAPGGGAREPVSLGRDGASAEGRPLLSSPPVDGQASQVRVGQGGRPSVRHEPWTGSLNGQAGTNVGTGEWRTDLNRGQRDCGRQAGVTRPARGADPSGCVLARVGGGGRPWWGPLPAALHTCLAAPSRRAQGKGIVTPFVVKTRRLESRDLSQVNAGAAPSDGACPCPASPESLVQAVAATRLLSRRFLCFNVYIQYSSLLVLSFVLFGQMYRSNGLS